MDWLQIAMLCVGAVALVVAVTFFVMIYRQ
jgi:hypothetical protein